MSQAWTLAKDRIEHAQKAQKTQYDRYAKDPKLRVGDRVMMYKPGEVMGKAWKLARPYHGRYRIQSLTPNNAEVERPQDAAIFMPLDRVRPCYAELGNEPWTGKRRKRNLRTQTGSPSRLNSC
jgi:hypothetical protein